MSAPQLPPLQPHSHADAERKTSDPNATRQHIREQHGVTEDAPLLDVMDDERIVSWHWRDHDNGTVQPGPIGIRRLDDIKLYAASFEHHGAPHTEVKVVEKSSYPEHEKMQRLRPQIDVVTAFLEWCEQSDILIGHLDHEYTGSLTVGIHPRGIRELLAWHFGIDETKLDAEKRLMLQQLRDAQAKLR